MIKQKRLYRVKVNIYFSSKLQLSYKIYKQKRLLHSSLPSGYSFIITSQIFFAFATTALKASG